MEAPQAVAEPSEAQIGLSDPAIVSASVVPAVSGADDSPSPNSQTKTFNVFVGDLKSEVTEEDLISSFSACGPIASSHIIRDRLTGEQRGYGFVHFKTLAGQQAALKAPFLTMEIRGRPVRVRPADDKTVLWVSSLPNDLNENESREALSALLPSNLIMTHFELKTGPPPLHQSRGFAFVSFETHDAADQARRILSKGVLKGRQLNVSWAEPQSEVDEQVMEKVTTLYVSNIHLAVTDEQLRALFSQFGDVKNCVIVKSLQTRESRGFAFIEFSSRRPCEMAIKYLHRTDFCGQPLEIVLAKPPPSKSATQPRISSSIPMSNQRGPSYGGSGRMGSNRSSGHMPNRGFYPSPVNARGGFNGGPSYSRGGYSPRGGGMAPRPPRAYQQPPSGPQWSSPMQPQYPPTQGNMYSQLGLAPTQQSPYPRQAPTYSAPQYNYPAMQATAYSYQSAQATAAAPAASPYYNSYYNQQASAPTAPSAATSYAQYSQPSYQQPAAYSSAPGYGAPAPAAASYPTAYSTQQAYTPASYAPPPYGTQAGYSTQTGYSAPQSYGQPPQQPRYGY